MANRRNIVMALGGLLLLPACASDMRIDLSQALPSGGEPKEANLVRESWRAAEALALRMPTDDRGPALVTTIADIDDLKRSSTLGRVLSEQVGNRLAQLGFQVTEARMTSAYAVSGGGEFMLSREAREVAQKRGATVAMVGTYGMVGTKAYVSLRLVRLADSLVVATHDFSVPVPVERVARGR